MFKNYLLTVRYSSILLIFTIVIQILLGAWVRLTGSGMSCPDWPFMLWLLFSLHTIK